MLCKLICAELMKLRRSPVWLAFIVMPVIPALMGTFNYLENLELLHSEWYSLWTQHTLFTDYIFLPLLIGIYCSYTMYIEQKNHNWNRVLTAPMPKGMVFAAKLVCVGFMILLDISKPFNKFKVGIVVVNVVLLLFCGIVLNDLFAISGMSWICVLLLIVFSLASATVFRLLTMLSNKLSKLQEKREEEALLSGKKKKKRRTAKSSAVRRHRTRNYYSPEKRKSEK